MTATETLSALRAAIKSNPNDLVARKALADAYEEMGKTALANKQREMIDKKEEQQQSKREERQRLLNQVRENCPKGSEVYGIVRSVSSSGMRRHISFFVIKDNKPYYLDYWMNQALGLKRDGKRDGLVIDGCGMDMCFATVYNLARVLYDDGYALSSRVL